MNNNRFSSIFWDFGGVITSSPFEAFNLFENLLNKLKLDFITILMNLRVIEKTEKQNNNTNIIDNPKCLLIIKKNQKISRNDRCEATGKKFKNCCGSL